jgi:hypothetical protein
MKFIFLAGGFIGFVLAAIAGLSAGRDAALVLRDAAIGCVAGALLFRWFWSVVVKALTETVERRRREALAAEAASQSTPAAPAPARSR